MTELHLPWLELSLLLPLLGALQVWRLRDPETARKVCVAVCGLTLGCAVGAWFDFYTLGVVEAHDRWDLPARLLHHDVLVVDELSAPLLPLAALLYLLTAVVTLRTKVRRFSFAGMLVSEALLLALLSCREPWAVTALLAAGTLPPLCELRARRKPTRVYVLHMALFVVLLVAGGMLVATSDRSQPLFIVGVSLLLAGVLVRCGIVPLHCWMTDLFEHAAFGTALLFVTPIPGAYAAVRLVLPIAPDGVLRSIGLLSLITAVYAAGMALVQKETRRFFCYLFLSHSALVLVGLEIATPVGLTGALCVWLSVGLALAGFGLTLRALEARRGRLSLVDYNGLHEHTPVLAACFLLTGLASVGFPGTFGFVGVELLVDGAVQAYPYVGVAVGLAAALNGIAVLQAYFRLFAGPHHRSSVSLHMGVRERVAVLTLAALIILGGLFPQPGVRSRHQAAMTLARQRKTLQTVHSPEDASSSGKPQPQAFIAAKPSWVSE